jgi:hypothetical protein
MSGWSGTIPEQLYTYVQTAKPTGAEEGESWYDLDDDKAYVFVDGQGSTTQLTLDDHAQLAGIGPADHHNPVTVSSPLVEDNAQGLSLSLANALTVDAGSLAVVESQIALSNLSGYPVGTGDLGFDTATQSELNAVDSNLSNHESDTSNPHNVTDDQTGAATALSNHESDAAAHHSRPSQTQQSAGQTAWFTEAEITTTGSVEVYLSQPAFRVRVTRTVQDSTVDSDETVTYGSSGYEFEKFYGYNDPEGSATKNAFDASVDYFKRFQTDLSQSGQTITIEAERPLPAHSHQI